MTVSSPMFIHRFLTALLVLPALAFAAAPAPAPQNPAGFAIKRGTNISHWLSQDFGWAPRENFESGMARTIRWYLDNRDWWQDILSGRYRGERLGIAKSA